MAGESEFLAGSQVMRLLLAKGPHWENRCSMEVKGQGQEKLGHQLSTPAHPLLQCNPGRQPEGAVMGGRAPAALSLADIPPQQS